MQSEGKVQLEVQKDPIVDPSMKVDGKEQENIEEIIFPEGGARAWCVAVGNAGVTFCTLGYINSFGVYQAYYETHQLRDTSPSTIAWIGSVQAFFIFGAALVGGPLFDRYGAMVMRPAAVAYVLSVMMTSLCTEYWQVMLAQGVLGGISNGLVMSPGIPALAQYFKKNRGGAMGLAIAGSSIGGVVFPIALSRMLNNPKLGFGWSVRVCGLLILAILLPACIAIKARLPPRKSQFLLPRAFLELQYTTLVICTFLLFLGMFTPLFFLPTYAVLKGMSPGMAFYLDAIINGASFPGRVIPGILAYKLGRMNMLIAAGISSGVLTLCWQRVESNVGLIVFSAIFGFCSGVIVSGGVVALASCPKDPKNIGTYMGMGMAAVSFAALIGPPINGALYNHYHSFDQVSTFSGVVCLAGGFMVIVAKWATGLGVFSKT